MKDKQCLINTAYRCLEHDDDTNLSALFASADPADINSLREKGELQNLFLSARLVKAKACLTWLSENIELTSLPSLIIDHLRNNQVEALRMLKACLPEGFGAAFSNAYFSCVTDLYSSQSLMAIDFFTEKTIKQVFQSTVKSPSTIYHNKYFVAHVFCSSLNDISPELATINFHKFLDVFNRYRSEFKFESDITKNALLILGFFAGKSSQFELLDTYLALCLEHMAVQSHTENLNNKGLRAIVIDNVYSLATDDKKKIFLLQIAAKLMPYPLAHCNIYHDMDYIGQLADVINKYMDIFNENKLYLEEEKIALLTLFNAVPVKQYFVYPKLLTEFTSNEWANPRVVATFTEWAKTQVALLSESDHRYIENIIDERLKVDICSDLFRLFQEIGNEMLVDVFDKYHQFSCIAPTDPVMAPAKVRALLTDNTTIPHGLHQLVMMEPDEITETFKDDFAIGTTYIQFLARHIDFSTLLNAFRDNPKMSERCLSLMK